MGLAACCDSFVTAKAMSGRVPSIMYRSDPITCWNSDLNAGLAVDVFGEGCVMERSFLPIFTYILHIT